MTNDILLIFLLTISASVGIFSASLMLLLFIRQKRAFQELEDEYQKLWERVLLHSESMIKRAHQQALEIVEQSQSLSSEMKQQVREALSQAQEREANDYQKTMQQIQQSITSESLKRLDDFSQKLIQETKKNEQLLEQKTSSVQSEISEYKNKRIKEIDVQLQQHLFELVQHILEEVTGKLLTQDQHEQLILDALKKAQKDHVL